MNKVMRPTKTIEQCIDKNFTVDKIKTSEYKESWDFAVIDQGKDLIAWYYSWNKQIYNWELPTIIYWDHTNIVKYIDFPFICWADWVKVLTPKKEIYAKYFYYVLSCVKPETQWYRRHYPLLKNIEIPLPPLETQKAIVAKLDQIFAELDQAKSEIQKNLDNTDELWKSALNQAFQWDWEMKKLGEICENFDNQRKPVTAGDRKKWIYPYYWASWIVDYVDNYIYDWDYLLVSEDWANLLARSTPIAFSISWKNWVNNHAHVLKFWNMTTQLFVERFLNFIDLSDYVTWSAQPKLNQKNLNDIKIPVPPLSEQEKIVEHLDQVSKEVKELKSQYQSQLDNLEKLKKSVLDKAFKWEI